MEIELQQAHSKMNEVFLALHPNAAAKTLADLPPEEGRQILQSQTPAIAAKIIEFMNADSAVEILRTFDGDYFRLVMTRLDVGRGAALLARMQTEERDTRLKELPGTLSREYAVLTSYPPETAGRYMDPSVTEFSPTEKVEEALGRIRKHRKRRVTDLCVVDERGRLLGTVPLLEVALSESETRLGELLNKAALKVQVMAPREDVVKVLEVGRIASLPVVDPDNHLLGVIRYDALVTAAQQDVTEDLQAMFGAGREEQALSPALFAVRKRLPWLQINLGTAFLAAAVVGLFEETIAKITALAIFLPVVAGQSGNTGSQALAVAMRGLALREVRISQWPRLAFKESYVGLINGIAVALTTSLVAFFWMKSAGLALVIGIAMVFAMVVAGFSGAIIPVILKALGQDPAQSSSIILTTVTDIVGFLSFLGLAKLMLSGS